MKLVVLVEFIVGAGGCLAGGFVALLLGATYAGNYPLPFEIGQLRGNELGGVLGAVIGGVFGASLGAFKVSGLSHAGNLLWSLCGAALGAVPFVAVLFLLTEMWFHLTGMWFFALIILVPAGAVVGLEAGKRIRNRSRPGKK